MTQDPIPEDLVLWVEVDPARLEENARRAVSRIGAGTTLLAVVKSNAYGHGAVAAARAFAAGGVEAFAVFLVDEAAELREAGIDAHLLLLGPLQARRAAEILELGLTPTIHCEADADALQEAAARRGNRAGYHLKVDTGMARLGVPQAELVPLLARLGEHDLLEMKGLYTHLVSGEVPHEEMGVRQTLRFREVIGQVRAAGHAPEHIHVANSAAVLAGEMTEFNAVRMGLALYGYSPAPDQVAGEGLLPALSLRGRIAQLRQIPAGATVGYAGTWTAARDSRIATVPVGYEEGYRRELGNRAEAILRGRRVPVVGRVSMDLTTLDVTDVPEACPGDVVTLLGEDAGETVDAWELARHAGTIAWDILCGIDGKLPRLLRAAGGAP